MRRYKIVVITLTAVAGMLVMGRIFQPRLVALSWHLKHGSNVEWDGHAVTLPLWWLPGPNSSPTNLELIHPSITGADLELVFQKKGPSYLTPSFRAASDWQQAGVKKLNDHFNPSSIVEADTIVTKGGEVFCIRSANSEPPTDFNCRVVGTDWNVLFVGDNSTASDARAIVASLR